jgi:hypothetical protein
MTNPGDDTICPICKSKAKLLDRTGDATGFDCERHGKFKIADTILAIPSKMETSREHWEVALTRAKERTKPGEWPVIKSDDLP